METSENQLVRYSYLTIMLKNVFQKTNIPVWNYAIIIPPSVKRILSFWKLLPALKNWVKTIVLYTTKLHSDNADCNWKITDSWFCFLICWNKEFHIVKNQTISLIILINNRYLFSICTKDNFLTTRQDGTQITQIKVKNNGFFLSDSKNCN